MFIAIKTTSPHKGIWGAERTGNSGTQLFYMPCWDFWCMLATQWWKNVHIQIPFSEIMNQIVYLKRALAIRKTSQLVFCQGNINFQFVCFSVLLQQLFSGTIFRAPQKDVRCRIETFTKIFRPWSRHIISPLNIFFCILALIAF